MIPNTMVIISFKSIKLFVMVGCFWLNFFPLVSNIERLIITCNPLNAYNPCTKHTQNIVFFCLTSLLVCVALSINWNCV